MYTVTVRDHVMIAHSFRGEAFGPAQRLHGATYVVDLELARPQLDPELAWVADIGRATSLLRAVLAELDYRNLDEHPAFAGRNTTTEFLAGWIHGQVARRVRAGELGPGGEGVVRATVTLHESHVASAAFEAPLADAPGSDAASGEDRRG
jgi:6-pyruvoyl-tetrahydropterin synthase